MTKGTLTDADAWSPDEVQYVRRMIGDRRTQEQWRHGDRQTWIWISLTIAALMLGLFSYLYFQTAGLIVSSPQSPSFSSTAETKAQAMAANSEAKVSIGNAKQIGDTPVSPVAPKGEFRDLLTILVPMFAAGVAFVVSAAGMRRLQSYDDELARARNERREDEKALRDELRDERKDFRDSVEKQVSEELEKRWLAVKSQLSELADVAKTQITSATDDARRHVEDIQNSIEKGFGFLKNRPYFSEVLQGKPVSVGDLHSVVSQLFSTRRNEDRAKALEILNGALDSPERMFGAANDWFNLSAQLGQSDLEHEALRVCKVALDRFADGNDEGRLPDVDLLAHAIQFANKLGEWSDCKIYVAQAEKMGREHWNWRLFVFVGTYYADRNDEDTFIELNKQFAELQPNKAYPYSQVSGYWQDRGQLDKALAVIQQGIDKPDISAEQLLLRRADILLDQCRYEDVIVTTNLALAATAVAQPGAAQWAILFKRANAFDALLFREIGVLFGNSAVPSMGVFDKAKARLAYLADAALAAYRSASKFRDVSLVSRMQGENRMRLILEICEFHGIETRDRDIAGGVGGDKEVGSGQRTLSSAEAKALGTQIASQFKELVPEQWDEIRNPLVAKLRGDFESKSLRLLADVLRQITFPDALTNERLRQFVALLVEFVDEDEV